MRQTLRAAAIAAALCCFDSQAHPGGLNSEGCHNNRKTGDYHCHRGGGPSRAPDLGASLDRSGDSSRTAGRAFANCSEARAAGAPPVRRGQLGYGSHLDRDNDGVGCE
jgi:hypothetical protein